MFNLNSDQEEEVLDDTKPDETDEEETDEEDDSADSSEGV